MNGTLICPIPFKIDITKEPVYVGLKTDEWYIEDPVSNGDMMPIPAIKTTFNEFADIRKPTIALCIAIWLLMLSISLLPCICPQCTAIYKFFSEIFYRFFADAYTRMKQAKPEEKDEKMVVIESRMSLIVISSIILLLIVSAVSKFVDLNEPGKRLIVSRTVPIYKKEKLMGQLVLSKISCDDVKLLHEDILAIQELKSEKNQCTYTMKEIPNNHNSPTILLIHNSTAIDQLRVNPMNNRSDVIVLGPSGSFSGHEYIRSDNYIIGKHYPGSSWDLKSWIIDNHSMDILIEWKWVSISTPDEVDQQSSSRLFIPVNVQASYTPVSDMGNVTIQFTTSVNEEMLIIIPKDRIAQALLIIATFGSIIAIRSLISNTLLKIFLPIGRKLGLLSIWIIFFGSLNFDVLLLELTKSHKVIALIVSFILFVIRAGMMIGFSGFFENLHEINLDIEWIRKLKDALITSRYRIRLYVASVFIFLYFAQFVFSFCSIRFDLDPKKVEYVLYHTSILSHIPIISFFILRDIKFNSILFKKVGYYIQLPILYPLALLFAIVSHLTVSVSVLIAKSVTWWQMILIIIPCYVPTFVILFVTLFVKMVVWRSVSGMHILATILLIWLPTIALFFVFEFDIGLSKMLVGLFAISPLLLFEILLACTRILYDHWQEKSEKSASKGLQNTTSMAESLNEPFLPDANIERELDTR